MTELDHIPRREYKMNRTSCLSRVSLGVLIALVSLSSDFAAAKHHDLSINVIYGDDDRLDLYEVQDQGLRNLAGSTMALMRSSDVTINGNIAHLSETPIGEAYRLCRDEPYYNQNSAAFCSGFLVGPDTVVTAGHCVRSQGSCSDTRFVFGFAMHSPDDRANQVPASDVYGCKELVHSVAVGTGEDFAVIKLDRPVLDREPLALSPQTASEGVALTVIGHPSGLPVKVAGGAEVREVKRQHLVANLDTYGGNSGSAVFNTQTGAVEGILVRGEADYVYENGCRRSNVCTNEGCRGEDVTLIKQVFPYLEQ